MSASNIELQNMVQTFKVCDLQDLLKCANVNRYGRKNELQKRALDLIQLNSDHITMKIIELYDKNHSVSAKEHSLAPINEPMRSNSNTSYHMTPLVSAVDISGYVPQVNLQMPYSGYGIPQYPVKPTMTFKDLPFYTVLAQLLNPISLVTSSQYNGHMQVKTTYFYFGSQNLEQLNSSSDVQIQLRIGILVTNCELEDDLPKNVSVKINYIEMSNIMSTKKPIDITSNVKRNTTDPQFVCISWPFSDIKPYMMGVFLVRKQTSNALIKFLKDTKSRNPDYTTAMIKENLCHESDSEIATMSLRGSLICPLGKNKMILPCRAINCTHLQCFDAHVYIQMNEKNPKWICPVCNKLAAFNSLTIDGLFLKIINESPSECTEVQFHENGSWTPVIPVKKVAKIQEITIQETPPKIGEQKEPIEIINITDNYTEDILDLDVKKSPSNCTARHFYENGTWVKKLAGIQKITIPVVTPTVGEHKKPIEIINLTDSYTENLTLDITQEFFECAEMPFLENKSCTPVNPLEKDNTVNNILPGMKLHDIDSID